MSTASQLVTAPNWRRVRARGPLLVLCTLAVAVILIIRGGQTGPADVRDAESALGAWLAERQLTLVPGELEWLEPPQGPFALRSALLLAHRTAELDDVYYVAVRQSHAALLDAWGLTNLTRSSSAAESGLTRAGTHVAFGVGVGDTTGSLVVLDTRGEPTRLTRSWPWYARIQNAITNLQETGRVRGFDRRDFQLLTPARKLRLGAQRGRFNVDADGARIVLDPNQSAPVVGADLVDAQPLEKGQPGTITWLVDTLRNVSFIGAEPIAWLEHTVFGLTDRATRAYHGMVQEDRGAEMRDALGAAPTRTPTTAAPSEELLDASDPDLQWPPAALVPLLDGKVEGEGAWRPVVDDPFVNAYPNAPPAFYQTFIRADAERPYLSVYVTLWDARQVQLQIAMGTAEPESATGETGSGLVAREPDVLKHLVGAFNGGFQALHGEFGMMADGKVYLPPKPFAATVGVFEDGTVGMGSWPGPGRTGWDEARANAQIPPDMIAMRQNLTSVVEDGRYNPWKRWWWGAAPLNAEEQTYIARSGLCLTQEGHMAFLWGETLGPEELGKAMLAVRCVRGMHLDMNTKHTGFEFYRPLVAGQPRPALGRALGELEFEGPIEHGLGIDFRARLAVKTMAPLRFPRYLARDPRDFFFLTLKPVLPGPELHVGGRAIGFSSVGLPHADWPHAFARAQIETATAGADANRVWLVRIDPARAIPMPIAPPELDQPLAHLLGVGAVAEQRGPIALYASRRRGLLRYAIGEPPSDARIVLRGQPWAAQSQALAMLGIDAEGFLLYGEAEPGHSAALAVALQAAGVAQSLALPEAARLAFVADGHSVSVDGKRELPGAGGIAFMAETRPPARTVFNDVQPKPYQHWGWLQGQRVRYFPSGPPRFPTPEEALTPAQTKALAAAAQSDPPAQTKPP